MDIQVVVQDQLNKIIADGKLEEIVRTKIEKTLDDVVQDLVRSYSDFGKSLKDEISKAFKIDFERISAVDYNHIVVSIVKEQLDKKLIESVNEPISEEIKDYFGQLEKKEWKLSEIIDKFKQDVVEDKHEGGEISLHIEKSNYGSTHISFDKEEGKRYYDCEYRMSINSKTGIPYSFDAGTYNVHRGDLRTQSMHGGFDKFFFRLYAQKAIITIDECEPEYYCDYD
jgi:SMC interacting uncharacterized protein involved in chromosome segregation